MLHIFFELRSSIPVVRAHIICSRAPRCENTFTSCLPDLDRPQVIKVRHGMDKMCVRRVAEAVEAENLFFALGGPTPPMCT